MTFEPNEDLSLLLSSLTRLTARHDSQWTPTDGRFQYCRPLDEELREGGFFDCAKEAQWGLPAAASLVLELAGLRVCVEASASALVAPLLCPHLPGPLAVVWFDERRPTRFLPVARSVLHVRTDGLMAARLNPGDAVAVDSLFAYPMGVLQTPQALQWERLQPGVDAPSLIDLWRLGIAAEITGCLQSGLDSVVAHVSERRQFNRPLGSFQAVQHRLASAASAIQAARWLTLKAAHSAGAADAATAAAYAQDMATRISYDLHQFMGAMGLTLEHPLHRWTYRTKLLRSELGGADRQFEALAGLVWPSP